MLNNVVTRHHTSQPHHTATEIPIPIAIITQGLAVDRSNTIDSIYTIPYLFLFSLYHIRIIINTLSFAFKLFTSFFWGRLPSVFPFYGFILSSFIYFICSLVLTHSFYMTKLSQVSFLYWLLIFVFSLHSFTIQHVRSGQKGAL